MEKLFDPERKFHYFGAGLFNINHGGLAIYIKYKKNPDRVELKSYTSRRVHISCPDRDLLLVGDANFALQDVAFDYDEVVNINPFYNQPDLKAFMVNYTQIIGKEANSPKLRRSGMKPEGSPVIISDSGGFQLQSEQLSYINPDHLTEWYNDNVDIGIVLDIPQGGYKWDGLIKHAAQAQAANVDRMLALKSDHLELMNVIHGYSFETATEYRSIVEREEIDRVCIGGAYNSTVMQSIDHAARMMTSGQQYKHYHMLGVGKIQQLYPYMRMAAKGVAPLITADSSTWLQEGLNKGYFSWTTVNAPPRYLSIGTATNTPNYHKILPCSCPVCSAVKYQDVFACFQGNVVSFMQAYHNLYAFTSFTEAMYDIIQDASLKDLKALVKSQLETRANGRDEALASLDYADSVAADGCHVAGKKLAYYLNINPEEYGKKEVRNLFGSQYTEEYEDPDVLAPDDPERLRIEAIFNSYISKDVIKESSVKVKKKDKIRKQTGHSKHTAKSVSHPGKKHKKPKKAKDPKAKKATK